MNSKFFASALFAGLIIAANGHTLRGQGDLSSDNGQETMVETTKNEKVKGRWHGKYFRTQNKNGEYRAIHHRGIKEEHTEGMEKNRKKAAKESARAKMKEEKAAKAKAKGEKAAQAKATAGTEEASEEPEAESTSIE